MADDKKGMLRHVDILGRVVIPREVRKSLRINYGDLMEFSVLNNKEITIRKFEVISDIASFIANIVSLIRLVYDADIVVTDRESVVCFDGNIKSEVLEDNFLKLLEKREAVVENKIAISNEITFNQNSYIKPLILNGDVLGGVVISTKKVIQKAEKDIVDNLVKIICDYFS